MFLFITLVSIVVYVMVSAHNDTIRVEREEKRQIAYDELQKLIGAYEQQQNTKNKL
jgi:hypothetical protein